MARIKIACPSMGREDTIIKSVIASYTEVGVPITVVVFENEIDTYCRSVPHADIVGIPNDTIGKPKKLNWILDNLFTDEYDAIMFLDDDIRRFIWTMSKKQVELSPEDFLKVLQEDYEINRTLGSHISAFGYYNGPISINRHKPFDINNPRADLSGGSMLLLDHGYRFDDTLPFGEDIDACFMNWFMYGIIWTDRRVGAVPLIPVWTPGSGGVSDFRNPESIKKVHGQLRQKYGSWVRIGRYL